MNEKQIKFVRALLALAVEMDRCLGMDEWTGCEEFADWSRDETIELDKLLEEVGRK